MSFAINTNIASLQAQNYLRTNSDFQAKTINRVTSGLRIISSGDDAAGLAIANTFRSDQAVLSQGVRNANDGLSQLQIADGGISNISQLLDRARTLATQSSSGAFTGDRSVLSGEFTTVLGEIDRQAQAIGLNQGGAFAKSLDVFIGQPGFRSDRGLYGLLFPWIGLLRQQPRQGFRELVDRHRHDHTCGRDQQRDHERRERHVGKRNRVPQCGSHGEHRDRRQWQPPGFRFEQQCIPGFGGRSDFERPAGQCH
jgi:hypothetical protein